MLSVLICSYGHVDANNNITTVTFLQNELCHKKICPRGLGPGVVLP